MVCEILFFSEFPDIPEKSRWGKKENSKAIAKHYVLYVTKENV